MDIYDSVIRSVQETLTRDGSLSERQVIKVSHEIVDRFRRMEGGRKVYLPKYAAVQRQQVKREFNGRNLRAVCRRHGISAKTVYRWSKK